MVIIFCVLLFTIPSSAEKFHWSIELLEKLPGSSATKANILKFTNPINHSSTLGNFTLPLIGFDDEIEGNLSNLASLYVLETRVQDASGMVSNLLMRSIVLNGVVPVLKMEYLPDATAQVSDYGNNLFHIHGALYDKGGNNLHELDSISWIYPLNFNKNAMHIYLSLPRIVDGPDEILPKEIVFHVVEHDYLTDGTLSSQSFSGTLSNPTFLTSSLDMVGEDNLIILSYNEFSTYLVKQLPTLNSRTGSCNNPLRFSVKLKNKLLHFAQSGTYLIYFDDYNKIVTSHWISFRDQILCPSDVSLPQGFGQHSVLLSSQRRLLSIEHNKLQKNDNLMKPEAIYTLREIEDHESKTACSFLSISARNCIIISGTFAAQCCYYYVLLSDLSSNQFIIVKFKFDNEDISNAKWEIIARFYNRLPESIIPVVLNYVLLDGNYNRIGGEIQLRGITDIKMARNCIYVWGNVLILHDLKSSLTFLVLATLSPPSPFFDNQQIRQYIPEKLGKRFALITTANTIWIGTISCSFRSVTLQKYNRTLQELTEDSSPRIIGMHFSYTKKLHLYALLSNSSFTKFEIFPESTPDSFRRVIASCSNLFSISKWQHFVVRPPLLFSPVSTLNQPNFYRNQHFMLQAYSDRQIAVHRVASYLMFQGELINVEQWWQFYDNARHWYFSDKGFNQFLEYVATNHFYLELPEHAWTAYLSQSYYTLLRNVTFRSCSIPRSIYLDRMESFSIRLQLFENVTREFDFGTDFDILVGVTNSSLLSYNIERIGKDVSNTIELQLTGLATHQRPSGVYLESVSVEVRYWFGHAEKELFNEDMVFEVKVGCPPGLSLKFDIEGSAAFGSNSEEFTCLREVPDNIPCIPVAEFSPVFIIDDQLFQTKKLFDGNFTLKVIGGGEGYPENIKYFSEEELRLYNFHNETNQQSKSLIWSVVNFDNTRDMIDKEGHYIFSHSNPTKIVFECQFQSPCGHIPLSAPYPSEYFVLIEVSNKNVDSSTNCDFTKRFIVLIVGIDLNPLTHFLVMLVTVCCILLVVYVYYLFQVEKGKFLLSCCFYCKHKDKCPSISHQLHIHEQLSAKSSLKSLGALQQPFFKHSGSAEADSEKQLISSESILGSNAAATPTIKISGADKLSKTK